MALYIRHFVARALDDEESFFRDIWSAFNLCVFLTRTDLFGEVNAT